MRAHSLVALLLLLAPCVPMTDLHAQSRDRLALADTLLTEMDFDSIAERFAPNRAQRAAMGDNATAESFQALEAVYRKYLTPAALRPAAAQAYAQLFSEQELRELIAFYRTPTAKKLTQLQPELSARLMAQVQEILRDHADEIVTARQGRSP